MQVEGEMLQFHIQMGGQVSQVGLLPSCSVEWSSELQDKQQQDILLKEVKQWF